MNLCNDSGAREAVFGTSGLQFAFGTAEEVDCQDFKGETKGPASSSVSTSTTTATGKATGTGPEGTKIAAAVKNPDGGILGPLILAWVLVLVVVGNL